MFRLVLGCIAMFMFSACGGAAVSTRGIQPPDWYKQRAEVAAVCGFGTVEYNGDYGLSETAAIDFARDELGKNMKARTQSYLEAARRGARQVVDGETIATSSSAQEQFVRTVNDNTVQFAIPKATELIEDQFFAMVCLDSNKYIDELKKNGEAAKAMAQGIQQIKEQSAKLDDLLKKTK